MQQVKLISDNFIKVHRVVTSNLVAQISWGEAQQVLATAVPVHPSIKAALITSVQRGEFIQLSVGNSGCKHAF